MGPQESDTTEHTHTHTHTHVSFKKFSAIIFLSFLIFICFCFVIPIYPLIFVIAFVLIFEAFL